MKPKVLNPGPEFLQHILVQKIRDIPLRRDYIESPNDCILCRVIPFFRAAKSRRRRDIESRSDCISDCITVTEGAELCKSREHGAKCKGLRAKSD